MTRKPILVALAVLLWAAGPVPAADLPLATATGAIEKVDKDSLTILTRGPDGKFAGERSPGFSIGPMALNTEGLITRLCLYGIIGS